MRIGGRAREVDARPSDAVALALYRGAPVFVTPEMLELPIVFSAPTVMAELEAHTERKRAERQNPPDPMPMEWRSFRTLPDPRTQPR